MFVIDKVLYTVVHHRSLVRMAAFGSIALIIILLFLFTPLADLLASGSQVFRLLAVVLILSMAVIYWMGSSSLTEVAIERKIHLYVFIIFSLLAFTGVMTIAQKSYAAYQATVDAALVKPIVTTIEQNYEKKVEDSLFTIFRKQVKEGKCEYMDYATKKGSGLTQFVYLKDDPALADKKPSFSSKAGALRGQNCVHQTKFLLTPEGKWYEVIE